MLARHEHALRALIRREAGEALLRFDAMEDLLQGVHSEALRSIEGFEWQGEEAFRGWLFQLARRHLTARRRYWFATKRHAGGVLRFSKSVEPMESATGPATFAFRREQLILVTKAIALLLPRDRDLVNWTSEGVSLEESAHRLGMTKEAAERARSRAFERLRKAYRVVSRS